ncbi:L,D-transpeptidase family protein [Bdellovibrio bacteriovorus]|uniref:L,D-transpeptidase family protein n=1 Tax=Bdellovibrio bacteriovorus TaxID=959 RepID=UPI0021CF5A53|nr:L,D-transpeptidase family protein [Bdellovibrio bacteriovorus]UXR63489.1 L,D-transpeptidase family protein [Bdellovibrio bacteriovorus]
MKRLVLIATLLGLTQTALADKYDCKNIDYIGEDSALVDLSNESVAVLQKKKISGDRIVVSKEGKKLYLFSGNTLLRAFPVALGRSPYGDKLKEGDNKTPEGKYIVDFKKKQSEYHRALHISYPNQADVAQTKELSKKTGQELNPGGDIMIHGLPNDETSQFFVEKAHPIINWTRGCIAVTNPEIEELFALVPVKAEVEICAARERGATSNPLKMAEDIAKQEPELKDINIPGKAQ